MYYVKVHASVNGRIYDFLLRFMNIVLNSIDDVTEFVGKLCGEEVPYGE